MLQTRERIRELSLEEKIRLVIDEWSRPFVNGEGGDITIEGISGHVVRVRLHGMCAGCASAGITLQNVVEAPLREFVDDQLRVVLA